MDNVKEGKQYAQGRITTLSQSIQATGLSVRQLARNAGVSRATVNRAIKGEGIQAYNFFQIENYIMKVLYED